MDDRADDADLEEYSPGFLDVDNVGVVSIDAFQLHGFATVESVQLGTPGFIPDDYLSAIPAETTVVVAELEAVGLWERREGGYAITESTALSTVMGFNEEMEDAAAACQARGSHTPDWHGNEWVVCTSCLAPLKRPDGKPVAGADGSPPDYGRSPKSEFGI